MPRKTREDFETESAWRTYDLVTPKEDEIEEAAEEIRKGNFSFISNRNSIWNRCGCI